MKLDFKNAGFKSTGFKLAALLLSLVLVGCISLGTEATFRDNGIAVNSYDVVAYVTDQEPR